MANKYKEGNYGMMTQDECLQVEQNMILSNVEIRQISIKVETRKSKIINKKSVNLRKLINYRQ